MENDLDKQSENAPSARHHRRTANNYMARLKIFTPRVGLLFDVRSCRMTRRETREDKKEKT